MATSPIERRLLNQLESIVGQGGVLADAVEKQPYLTDLTKRYHGEALAVVRPGTAGQTAQIVRLCAANAIAVTAYGGGTGLCGGAIPAGNNPHLVLSFERLRAIRLVDPVNDAIIVEAGCPLATVQNAAANIGRLFPISHGAEGTSQIGGMIATNAGGNKVVRYGMTRQHVLGLEVVLPDGTIWDGLRLLRKDNSGYDLKQLFIGSEGTLGIITAAALSIQPAPAKWATALVAVDSAGHALDLYDHLRGKVGGTIGAIELMPRSGLNLHFERRLDATEPFQQPYDWMVLIELEAAIPGIDLDEMLENALADALTDGVILDAILARSQAHRASLWALREGLAEAQAGNQRVLKSDTSVPVGAVAKFVAQADAAVQAVLPGAIAIPFGHIGDGNIHFNVMAPNDVSTPDFLAVTASLAAAIADVSLALDGSISAEHGLGQLKRDGAEKSKSTVESHMMRLIKSSIDPHNLFNPGKVIDADSLAREKLP
ncbi:MAG: FAD-binding oxidoreductase [Alphaproteobacteria bacterium]